MYWYVCLFPISTVANYHELSGLKQCKCEDCENGIYFLLSNTGQTQVSMGCNQGISRTVFLLGVLGRIHFPAFPASKSCLHPWLRVPFIFKLTQLWLISQTWLWCSRHSCFTATWSFLWLWFFLLQEPLWLQWVHRDIPVQYPCLKILNLMTSVVSLAMQSIKQDSQIPGLRMWTCSEGQHLVYHNTQPLRYMGLCGYVCTVSGYFLKITFPRMALQRVCDSGQFKHLTPTIWSASLSFEREVSSREIDLYKTVWMMRECISFVPLWPFITIPYQKQIDRL